MIEVSGIPLSLDAMLPQKEALQKKEVARALGVKPEELRSVSLLRKSVDARKKSNVHFTTTFACELSSKQEQRLLNKAPKGLQAKPAKPYIPLVTPVCDHTKASIIVVGAGPAGLFAALYLARCGLRPILVERGFDVEQRARDIAHFEETGTLNPHSNIQFGEGGAGTFSDGKLTTNIKSPYAKHVLHWFVDVGAPKSILVESHPHLGSDNLPKLVATMRNEIINLGGEVRFGTRLSRWNFTNGKVSSVDLEDVLSGQIHTQQATHVVLACGHSARDVFELSKTTGLAMEQKPFSIGVRIEHAQSIINQAQWGKAANHPALGAASYKLAVHLPEGRSVYTFCMCPGGEVVAAASEEGGVVTNGMSEYARAGKNANAALLVNVEPDDFESDDVLAGVRLQRRIEHAAFELAKKQGAQPYQAPCQTVGDFLKDNVPTCENTQSKTSFARNSNSWEIQPTYGRGTFNASLNECFPEFIVDALAQALPLLGKKLAHFDDPQALMTAPETRSSSPVRIKRGKHLQAYWNTDVPNDGCGTVKQQVFNDATGIYPCGEGPGFAGGIMSAACDGLRVASSIAESLCL